MQIIPVVLSGGTGSRLWPLSRKSHPKPFIKLPDGETLIQKTLRRIAFLQLSSPVLTITNRDYYFLTRDTYQAFIDHQETEQALQFTYILEPTGRNTAPAVAIAALWAQQQFGDDTVLLILPADHITSDDFQFKAAVQNAITLSKEGYLVTFGITPDVPETGYGYIQQGSPISDAGFQVQRFVEKPDKKTAQEFLDSGEYLWNSGMFCLRVGDLLLGMEQFEPEVISITRESLLQAKNNGDTWDLSIAFAQVKDISLDYALLELAANVAVVKANFGWNDMGSWAAYSQIMPADAQGNTIQASESVLLDTQDCLLHSPYRLTTMLGVKDLIVVDTPDALLIAHKDKHQEVKDIVQILKKQGHETIDLHRTVHRPWGSYTILEEGHRFKIKRILVKPHNKLSLQMHHHRSEHWIVVSGTAKIVNGEQEILIQTNESTYIPAGHQHRLENPGVIDLILIEVQSGEYLGEDDIIRFKDVYGRC